MAFKKAKPTDKAMNKADTIAALAEETELSKKDVDNVIKALAQLAYAQAHCEAGFTVPGLGKIEVKKRAARMGRNPATKEPMKIPAGKVVKFKVGKACKDAIVPPKK